MESNANQKMQTNFNDTSVLQIQNNIIKEIQYLINIKETPIQFALTFEITENNTFLFSIFLIEPQISFNGQLTVILHNQAYSEKSIVKNTYISFTPVEYDIQPISFDLSPDQISDSQSGWIVYKKETNEVSSGLHFTIKFEPPETIHSQLSQFKIETEKKLFDEYPVSISMKELGKFYTYSVTINFNKQMYDFHKPYKGRILQTGGFIIYLTINFATKTVTFNILETLFPEGKIYAFVFLTNIYQDDLISRSKTLRYSATKRQVTVDLPFSIDELYDDSKGWLKDNSINMDFFVKTQKYDVTCLYPIKLMNSMKNGYYGIKYFIPLSLFTSTGQQFSPIHQNDQILFNPFYTNCLSVTPQIQFAHSDSFLNWADYKLKAKTRLQFNYYKQDVIFGILVTFVNKDKEKNVSTFFSGVSQSCLELPSFELKKTIEEEGFQLLYNSTEVIEMDIKIHIYNDDVYNDFNESEEKEIIIGLCKDKYHFNSDCTYFELASDEKMSHDFFSNEYENEHDDDDDNNNQVVNDPNNNSKSETGYVGLCNQGATCYLNSYLQTLFHLPAFRKIVYEMPTTGNEDPKTSIPLNIQRLFCQLQFSEKACSTVNLTKSFGWNSIDSFQQHDIEEFSRVLIDNLEKKLKGTDLENSIPQLFRGRFRNYIKCKNVDYTSYKEETFYDLSMDVKGIPNLSESFKSYIKPDELIGDNQYDTEKFGKQDAMMGTEFLEFPPILHIHLRRFMVDFTSINGMTKINDRFEFPETIDLTEYLADDSPQKKESNLYDLYGVLVHSGGYSGGHYYAFLRTSTDPQWFKFNDSYVTKDTVENAVYNNFGSSEVAYSGYMLIYVRKKDAKLLYEPISEDSFPDHLMDFEKKKQTIEKNVKVHFIHEDCLRSNMADKMLSFFRKDEKYIHVEEYERSTTIAELYLLLGSLFCLDPFQFRLWICYYQKVPRKVIVYSEEKTLDELTKGRNELYVLVQPIKENEEFNFKKQSMIYIDFFFTENLLIRQDLKEDDTALKKQKSAPLQFLSSLVVSKKANIASSVVPFVVEKLGFSQNAKFECYQALLNGSIQKVNITSNLDEYGIGNGSILIFEMKQESIDQIEKGSLKLDFEFQSPTENSIENELNRSLKLYSEIEFNHNKNPLKSIYSFLTQYFTTVVYNYKDKTVPLFRIELTDRIRVPEAKKYIIEAAKKNKNIDQDVDENSAILFYFVFLEINEYDDALKLDSDCSRVYFLVPSCGDLKLTEITVQFSPDAKTVTIEKVISLKDCKNFDDVCNAFKSSFSEEEKRELFRDDQVLRYLIIQNGSIEKVIDKYDYLSDLKPGDIMRIEVIPENQLDESESFLFKTVYSNSEFSKTLSFLFLIELNEKFSETKKKIIDYSNQPDNGLNFYLHLNDVSLILSDKKLTQSRYLKKANHEYHLLVKNDKEGFVRLDDSAVVSDFIPFGSFSMTLIIVPDKTDELKKEFEDDAHIKNIRLQSLMETNDDDHSNNSYHNDLKIYN